MTESDPQRILVLAPTSRDAALSYSVFDRAGIPCLCCRDLGEICNQLETGAGAVLLPEEAIVQDRRNCLVDWLTHQPPWSDLPILVLARPGADSAEVAQAMDLLKNVTVLERPMRVVALVSAARTALRARQRQYQIRNYLAEQERSLQAQALLGAIVASSDDAIVSKTLEGIILSWNAGAERLFGYSATEAIGQPITLLIPPERHDEESAILERLRRGERIEHFETVRVRKDGSLLDISLTISPLKDSTGHIIGASKIARDITERKRAERALRESETRFRQLADAMPQIVWAARPDGYIDYYNQRWYEYTGFAEGYGQESWEPILHPDDVQRCVETYFGCIRTGEPYQIEYRFKDPFKGGYRWFMGRALPIKNEEGRIVRWFGTCTDIDDLKQAEETLKEVDRRRNEFLATLAHELRNPLAPILNAVQLLALKRPADPDFQWEHALIERQVKQLSRLVDDLLDVSRISRGKINLRTEPLDLAAIVRQAIEISGPLIAARHHHLEVSLPNQAIPVEGDPIRLTQVVSNLLNNAAKYTEDGGRIDLAIEQNGLDALIRVRDTGIGIAPAMLPQIFEIFTQVQGSVSRSEGGLGIGLSLVRSLVELHGGSVQAFSGGVGQGSEFVVRLPLLQDTFLPALAQERKEEKHRAPPKHILVVDDNKDSAESLAVLLRLVGHEVRLAHTGPAGLNAAQERAPEVVLLDIGLPIMDGLEVARRLRQDLGLINVLLVAMTGYGQEDFRNRTQEAGFNAHLVKPLDLDALEELLAHAERLKDSQAAK
jgi:PAS domain S-box-containing protein